MSALLNDSFPDPAPLPPDVAVYGFDIETDTEVDGFDPHRSSILAVAIATPFGERAFTGPEPALLRAVDHALRRLEPGILATWNGATFDLPFLVDRAATRGVNLGLVLRADPSIAGRGGGLPGHPVPYRAGWYRHRHLDAYRLYRNDVGVSLGVSCSLKAVARLVGLDPLEVDRELVHQLAPDRLAAYVASDAATTRRLVERRRATALTFTDPALVTGAGQPWTKASTSAREAFNSPSSSR